MNTFALSLYGLYLQFTLHPMVAVPTATCKQNPNQLKCASTGTAPPSQGANWNFPGHKLVGAGLGWFLAIAAIILFVIFISCLIAIARNFLGNGEGGVGKPAAGAVISLIFTAIALSGTAYFWALSGYFTLT